VSTIATVRASSSMLTDAEVADVAVVVDLGHLSRPDHVAGNVVSTDLVAHPGAALDGNGGADLERVQGGEVERLLDGIEPYPVARPRDHRLAYAVDRHARTRRETLGELLVELDLIGEKAGLPLHSRDLEGPPCDA
jgi:hypothetical protein